MNFQNVFQLEQLSLRVSKRLLFSRLDDFLSETLDYVLPIPVLETNLD